MSSPAAVPSDQSGSSSARRRRRAFAWVCAVVLAAVVVATLWVGIRGFLAVQHLESASATAGELVAGFQTDGTLDEGIADRLIVDTSAAHALTSDPIWLLASTAPWIGPQLAAASASAEAADIAASDALPALVAQGSIDMNSLLPTDGRIDGPAIAELQQPLETASEALARSAAVLDTVDAEALLTPLATQFTSFRALVDGAAVGADSVHRAAVLLPGMLGADGPRTYLLLFQNNAEWRSLGGNPGQIAHITAEDGKITLDQIVAASDFPRYTESVLPLADDVEAVYQARPGVWIQDVTQVPDFTISAQLAREMWNREFGDQVDGVFAVDTVTLSYLLAATGPLALPSGDTITSDNAVSLLLNEVYFRYPAPSDQDAFFGAVAGTVFTALTAGSPEPASLLQALARAGSERRLLAWSAVESEQAVIDGTTLAGALPVTDAEQATFGVFLNDGTGSKMDYYLTVDTAADWTQCTAELNVAALTVTLANASPPVDELPSYITGASSFGVPAGITRTVIYAYLPEGYELIGSDLPEGVTTAGGYHDGRHVVSLTIDQNAGDSTTLTLIARGPAASVISVMVTPSVNAMETVTGRAQC